jgi:hypothetical protein
MALILKTFSCTVSTAGTAVPLSATAIRTSAFAVRAKLTNGGNVYVGDNSVVSSTGMFLQPGETNSKSASTVTRGHLQEFNLNKIYLNADANGDGAIIEYITEEP